MLYLFLINLCFSQVLGEANELIVSKIVLYKGIMKETKRGPESNFFVTKTVYSKLLVRKIFHSL